MAGINLKFQKVDKILRKNGFQCVRHSGSHSIYKKGDNTLSIPNSCNGLIIQRLFRENNIDMGV